MRTNKKTKQMAVVLLIAALIFSVCVFIIPFKRNGTFWIAYISEMLAFLLQIPVFRPTGKNASKLKSKALGVPLFCIGYLYLAVQTIISLLLFALNILFETFPAWASLVICLIVIAAAFVSRAPADIRTSRGKKPELALRDENALMQSLCAKTENIALRASDENSRHMLQLVAESFRYSDPLSNNNTREIEIRLKSIVTQLDRAVSEKRDIVEYCAEIADLLNKRNEICKMS